MSDRLYFDFLASKLIFPHKIMHHCRCLLCWVHSHLFYFLLCDDMSGDNEMGMLHLILLLFDVESLTWLLSYTLFLIPCLLLILIWLWYFFPRRSYTLRFPSNVELKSFIDELKAAYYWFLSMKQHWKFINGEISSWEEYDNFLNSCILFVLFWSSFHFYIQILTY